MKKLVTLGSILLGLGLLACFGFAVWLLVKAVWSGLAQADSAVLAAFVTGGVVVIGASWAKYLEHVYSVKAQFREKKVGMYNEFLEYVDRLHTGNVSSHKLTDEFKKWKRKTMFWGSPKVMRGFMSMSEMPTGTKTIGELAQGVQIIGDLLLAMRKDVGLSNYGITPKRYSKLNKGTVLAASYMMRNSDLFLTHAQQNPSMPQEELVRLEKLMEQATSTNPIQTKTHPSKHSHVRKRKP